MSVHTPSNTFTVATAASAATLGTKATTPLYTHSASPVVKTLSLSSYLCQETRPLFLKEMRESLMRIGTFYIKDHGIPSEITADAMKTVQEYFALPLDEKKKMLIGNSRHYRGYKLIGEEITNNEVDHREQLQFGPEQPAIKSFIASVSPDYEGLPGPNQWPESTLALIPNFQPAILELMDQLQILSQHLMEAIALSLGCETSYFRDLFGPSPYYRLKCARYPSVAKAATIGCGAHKDTGFLTVLLQDMVGGLQGQDPYTGQWMDTRPIPDTFIITMGEAMERLTGGLYKATVHRVLNNTSDQDRYSIPFFFDPALDVKVPHRIPRTTPLLPNSSSARSLSVSSSSTTLVSISDEESIFDDDLESQVEALSLADLEDASSSLQGGWSNGESIFKTVQSCHPEVYTRWYGREL
ncbi:hypothetical protein BGZ99_001923 [Dissophora globulifera]|uniref:Fe2OG dioxygenase domain-containing protein n=1 Tax=Dissophora globulifera TaxID=979702 RepID=A0A9P6UXV0_9FUNG|nr:hypothetical protein BGZ99_001923 [Dissophora globulifera]